MPESARNVLRAATLSPLIDYDPEAGILTWKPRNVANWDARFAGAPALHHIHSTGYRSGTIFGRTLTAHRIIWALVYDEAPEAIDHINGDRADNRLCNLRAVTKAENAKNRVTVSNTSGICGVYFNKANQRWQAFINVEKRRVHLGVFESKEAAATARKSAEADAGYSPNHGRIARPRAEEARHAA